MLATYLAALPAHRPLILLPHSNAGAFVPALAAERDVVSAIFVDAGVPPAAGDVAVAPPAFRDFLDGLADADRRLPPWTA